MSVRSQVLPARKVLLVRPAQLDPLERRVQTVLKVLLVLPEQQVAQARKDLLVMMVEPC